MQTEDQGQIETPWLVRNLSKILVGLVAVAASAGIVVLVAYINQFGAHGVSSDQVVWAAFGDFVGGTLNVVVAYCALIALALTLRVQSIELKLSTQELSRSAKALSEQNRSIAKQSFESTFFQLLRLHNDNIAGLDLRRSGNVVSEGRDCFKAFASRLDGYLQPFLRGEMSFDYAYSSFYENNGQNLGHYFRYLYRVYKFVSESNVEDKRNYSGIVRAQLSDYELVLLYYNGLSSSGAKFRQLIEEFSVLENMDFGLVGGVVGAEGATYAPGAFGDRVDAWSKKMKRDGLV